MQHPLKDEEYASLYDCFRYSFRSAPGGVMPEVVYVGATHLFTLDWRIICHHGATMSHDSVASSDKFVDARQVVRMDQVFAMNSPDRRVVANQCIDCGRIHWALVEAVTT